MDDGAELVAALHSRHPELVANVVGGTEETSSGVQKLRAMVREGVLRYPLVSADGARTKLLFDNRYGAGQGAIDGLLRATNVLLAGCQIVVAGYGATGRSIAARAHGLGARVIITEIDPLRAVEAVMDGFRVLSMAEACAVGDIFITATGNRSVIGRDHFDKLRNGAILCNAGHSNVEIDLETLAKLVSSRRRPRELIEEYAMRDGRRIYVLGEGRQINLAAAEGHPAAVMDLSFANQALAVEYLVRHHDTLENRVHPFPADLDRQVARIKLESMGVKIDRLTPEQEKYLSDWSESI
jgi:adenosylhomocysteinase